MLLFAIALRISSLGMFTHKRRVGVSLALSSFLLFGVPFLCGVKCWIKVRICEDLARHDSACRVWFILWRVRGGFSVVIIRRVISILILFDLQIDFTNLRWNHGKYGSSSTKPICVRLNLILVEKSHGILLERIIPRLLFFLDLRIS